MKLVCLLCSNKLVKFDLFMYFFISVSSVRERMIKVIFVSYGDEFFVIMYGLKLFKNGEIVMLFSVLCEVVDIDMMDECVVFCEVYNYRMEKIFSNMFYLFIDIRECDVIYVYCLLVIKDNDNVEIVDIVFVYRKELN